MFLNSHHMYHLAVKAHERCKQRSLEDAIVTVILAAASLEGFLNELVGLLRLGHPNTPPKLPDLVGMWEELENTKVQTRFSLAASLLGRPFDKGGLPYQECAFLFQVRNELVHLKPRVVFHVTQDSELIIPEPPKILEGLRARKLIRKVEDKGLIVSWYNEIMTPEVAAWACNTVVDMADYFMEAIPAGPTKRRIEYVFRESFHRPA